MDNNSIDQVHRNLEDLAQRIQTLFSKFIIKITHGAHRSGNRGEGFILVHICYDSNKGF